MKNHKKLCHDIYYASDVVNKELTFGCEIKFGLEDPHKVVQMGVESNIMGYYIDSVDGCYESFSKIDKELKIIGHPPTGFDWLRLMRKNPANGIDFHYEDGGKDLELRYDDTEIYFNLTTNEPTSYEALYKVIK